MPTVSSEPPSGAARPLGEAMAASPRSMQLLRAWSSFVSMAAPHPTATAAALPVDDWLAAAVSRHGCGPPGPARAPTALIVVLWPSALNPTVSSTCSPSALWSSLCRAPSLLPAATLHFLAELYTRSVWASVVTPALSAWSTFPLTASITVTSLSLVAAWLAASFARRRVLTASILSLALGPAAITVACVAGNTA